MLPEGPSYANPGLFLWDGLKWRTSQGLLLVGDEAGAQQFARLLHEHGSHGFQAAAPGAEVARIDPAAIAGISRDHAAGLCDQAREGGHWLYLENVGQFLDSTGGRNLLEAVCETMANASLPCVIASTPPHSYQNLTDSLCRLLGLVLVAHMGPNGMPESMSEIVFLGGHAEDRSDTGWIVAVRYQLTSPMVKDPPSRPPDPEADSALRMVDKIQVVGRPERPQGVMISFRAEAFAASQQRVVFHAAEVVARRVVGRSLGPNELVEARRAIYFT